MEEISSYFPLDCIQNEPFWLGTGGTWNGKLEAPSIRVDGNKVFASWDASQSISSWSVPGVSEVLDSPPPPLKLCNHPTRGVTGHLWDGTEMCWKHKPSHYGAIHFHEDDLYDLGWKCTFEWKVPLGMPSGVYLMRLRVREFEEALPLFICSPIEQDSENGSIRVRTQNDTCILIPTFTYVMYGNHARPDYDEKSWQQRAKEWKAYPHNPAVYANTYGASTYNVHSDGSGICFASNLRPLFNLRPGFCTFASTTCSGLRHFPADTHLIAWMHHHHLPYDIVTDHDLHQYGLAAISSYSTVVTCSHPEYHSIKSLNALQSYRDEFGGNIMYLGGNGFYWRITTQEEAASVSNDCVSSDPYPSLLEIRRSEDGVRTWAAEVGEYYHAIDGGTYGGLWRRNGRPPQQLVGVGFSAQGTFHGKPFRVVSLDNAEVQWIWEHLTSRKDLVREKGFGYYGLSGNGAAGFEWDRVDHSLDADTDYKSFHVLACAVDPEEKYMLVPEEVLTTYSNTAGLLPSEARRADMVWFQTKSGSCVFSVGSITYCGCLPFNNFENDVSTVTMTMLRKFSAKDD